MTGESAADSVAKPVPVLPSWAKFLAALSGAVIILGGAGGAYGISWARKLCLDSVDPVYIRGTIKQIGNFPDDIGWHPVVAIRVMGAYGVAFNEGPDKVQFDLAKFESEESDPDPKEIIDLCYDRPAVFAGITGSFVSIADKGKADINGHEFLYQTGLLKDLDTKGQSHRALIGCLTVGRKVVVVEAAAPINQSLDTNMIIDFLRKAHSF